MEVHYEEIGEGEEGERDGEGEETMSVARLKDERNGRKNVRDVNGKEKFAETAIDKSKWRNGIYEDDHEG